MVIIWGTRLMGKVDVVPGLFHVATQFGHLNYLPLIPLKTYLIVSQNGDSFNGLPIGFSFKSMLMAWARTALFLVAVVTSFVAAAMLANGKVTNESIVTLAIAVGAWAVFALTWHRVASRASFRRACELGELIGLNEAGFAMLHEIYGEAPPRGFAPRLAPIPAEPVADVSIVPVSALAKDSYVSTPRPTLIEPVASLAPQPEPAPAVAPPATRETERLGL